MEVLFVGGPHGGKFLNVAEPLLREMRLESPMRFNPRGINSIIGVPVTISYKLIKLRDADGRIIRFYLHGGDVDRPLRTLLEYYIDRK